MEQDVILRSVGTHDGTFHADEVTACALLLFCDCVDRQNLFRTRDPRVLERCEYVCDVGGIFDPDKKRFDHHQIDYTGDFSSCGMVLEFLERKGYFSSYQAKSLRDKFVKGIDDDDCGRYKNEVGVSTFSMVVSSYNDLEPFDQEKQTVAFNEALEFCLGYLHRFFRRQDYVLSCFDLVKEKLESSSLALVFDKHVPWMENFFLAGGERHPALFLVMPSHDGWHLRAIPQSKENTMISRRLLPQAWAGLLEKDFERESGLTGGVFCHKGRFLSVWKCKEDALRALEFVLKLENDDTVRDRTGDHKGKNENCFSENY
ncbi:MYG1 family protein [Candidatus Similichlamydia laticola]|uniref:MYG1 protein n=1 Tax=Candidatus Similichlamydia laticola TaxID=2170265 RepID=A0A369KEU9_9BACT|nr:MYG1 family protein [Candidatus Similichlamydia laticola]RDB31417.1 hypothetical protein HAT2_00478 [Candidatus Similichlamydia laticola]